jgi:predicted metalloprotease with PDZ domain
MRPALVTGLLLAVLGLAQEAPVRVRLDATDVPHRLLHVQMTMPVEPGPLTLQYPQWIPGEHGPTGPINDLVNLKFSSNGQPIPWDRDTVDMFGFHMTVPPGVTSLDISFDFILQPDGSGFSSGASADSDLAVLSWNQVLLYPKGTSPDQLRYQATLRVPASWRYGTALPVARESGSEVEFQPVSLTTLIDSPVSTGTHYRTIDLGTGPDTNSTARHYLHLVSDSDAALEMPAEEIEHYKNLVAETGALFGSRHYGSYHFLLTLSDHVAHFGLEHHESSDDRIGESGVTDETARRVDAGLLPHEFVHSWNGKYRRPAGLATPDYNQPMKGDLLWIYEGLTEYLGEILTPRSGLQSADDFRDELAINTAELDRESGRTWRPLEDTAAAAQLLYDARGDYAGLRRSVDFYEEGTLIWLEVDVMIRQLSHGAKSLDDFCRAFHGGPGGAPALKPYSFEDVVAALNAVQPYDWAALLRRRVYDVAPRAPVGGIENGGWKLIFNETPSSMWRAREAEHKQVNLSYSLGMLMNDSGTVEDVAVGGPAQKAGISPAEQVIAVNGHQYSSTIMHEAVAKSTKTTELLELLIKDGEYYRTMRVDYHGGERYPHLERDESKPDVLSQIIAPKAKK